jgi:hypothetical protein
MLLSIGWGTFDATRSRLDIETVLDVSGFAAANNLFDKSAEEVRDAMGDNFPKHIYHSIICIGSLVSQKALDPKRPIREANIQLQCNIRRFESTTACCTMENSQPFRRYGATEAS